MVIHVGRYDLQSTSVDIFFLAYNNLILKKMYILTIQKGHGPDRYE